MIKLSLLIVTLPLIAFTIQILVGKRLPRDGDFISLASIFVSWILSLKLLWNAFSLYDPQLKITKEWLWFDLARFSSDLDIFALKLPVGILLDNVSILMLVVVTTVSFLVHFYSIGYMKGDAHYSRFFAYLSLFSFSMLGLVLTDNLFVLYIFWELVGVCSYLLIGFWFEKRSAANACKKAFLTTRVGDIGLFIGIMMVFTTLGSVSYSSIFEAKASGLFSGVFGTIAGLCIFMGAVGKSAQFPLHIWLPDAMEGPTPVSALIHAATMVAAGVYLVVRLFVFFTPDALLTIAYVGGFTALFAATMALTHQDIKKVLAYSTVSQLGLMMLALGVGAYTAGFFHLVTHASFKACLFLVSGSVIHALHGEQNLFKMGGLRKKMPLTFGTCLIATLAIAGVPLFSGFVSKDQILAGTLSFAYNHPPHSLLAFFGFGASALTAFYMFRLLFLTFFGKPRDEKLYSHAHESSFVITLPLIILAILSLGFIYEKQNWFEHLIQKPQLIAIKSSVVVAPNSETLPIFKKIKEKTKENVDPSATPQDDREVLGDDVKDQPQVAYVEPHKTENEKKAHTQAMVASVFFAFFSIFLAWLFYIQRVIDPEKVSEKYKSVYNTLVNLYWIDEAYQFLFIGPLIKINNFLYKKIDSEIIDQGFIDRSALITVKTAHAQGDFDNTVIDRGVDGTAHTVFSGGLKLVRIQTGQVQDYLKIGLGLVIILLIAFILM
ncbi:MAG: NADH-quinone oxidoreductase subunit L [Deltaproteobacteria bacterium]|nr:NADH-quinone oxidoreductase subunit L [Deltaproteobacteria bacterium]